MRAASKEERFNIFRYVDAWWFDKGSPTTLGLFRIIIAGLAFTNLAMIGLDFTDWYSEAGFVPQEVAQRYGANVMRYAGPHELPFGIPRVNLLGGIENDWIAASFYVLVMAAALTTMVGLWTRLSSIVLAVGMVTLHHRNLLILHGGDTALRQFLIIIAVAPSGAACSLDRVFAVWRGKAAPGPNLVSLWGQRLLQYQIAILYLTATWYKWQGAHWRDGTATWYISQLREFDRFPVPEFMERQPIVAITTYGTLLTELAMATLVFYRPLRKWVLLAALAMHGYIEYRFNIPMFAFVVTSAYVCFYDGEEIAAWAKRLGSRLRRLHVRVLLPAGAKLDGHKGDAIRSTDPLGLVTYESGETAQFSATTASGKRRNPFRCLVEAQPWSMADLPGTWRKMLLEATDKKSKT